MPELDVPVSAVPGTDPQSKAGATPQEGSPHGGENHLQNELSPIRKVALFAENKDHRSERRREMRFKGPRQVWIQATNASGSTTEEIQIMRNYSLGGFYFVTSQHHYSVGMHLRVIPSLGSLNLEFIAEVVRVEPRPRMAYGVAVKLLHVHEPIAPENSGKA